MTTRTSTYPLRLPASLKAAVEKLSKRDGTSINPFVVIAVAERIAAMTAEEVFAERRARADLAAFDRIMSRKGGEPPRPGDELPPDLAALGVAMGRRRQTAQIRGRCASFDQGRLQPRVQRRMISVLSIVLIIILS